MGTGASVRGRGNPLPFYDAVDVFSTRLREHRLLDTVDDAALQALNEYVLSVQTTLFQDGPFVMDAPEWERVRSLAATAAASLRRPPEQKLA